MKYVALMHFTKRHLVNMETSNPKETSYLLDTFTHCYTNL